MKKIKLRFKTAFDISTQSLAGEVVLLCLVGCKGFFFSFFFF